MKLYNQSLGEFKQHYMLYVPLTIIFQSCLGSIATMAILSNTTGRLQITELTISVCLTMLYNVSILGRFKINIILNILIMSVLLNTVLFLINI